MRKLTYFAVFELSTEGNYGVYFPDLPGCVSMGDNFEHALNMAQEALGLHVWGMEKDNESIPESTQPPFEDVPAGSIIVPVTTFPEIVKNEIENKSEKTNVTIPAWLKKLAEKEGVNFSQLLQVALKEYLGIK